MVNYIWVNSYLAVKKTIKIISYLNNIVADQFNIQQLID